ncbi:MAG: sigma-70 family RNA polymerase sigma factor [Planctomycetota bacterium]
MGAFAPAANSLWSVAAVAAEFDTCWTVVRGAAAGDEQARSQFAHHYLRVVRAFLAKRWRGTAAITGLDDAIQEVFVDLFRDDGALRRLDPERATSFRAFLFGVTSKVAMRHESRAAGRRERRDPAADPQALAAEQTSMSRAFDREWARGVVERARHRHRAFASARGERAIRRVELLELRFGEDLPIREIAKRWNVDSAWLHHEYASARDEFKQALRAEVAFDVTGPTAAVDTECRLVLELLE